MISLCRFPLRSRRGSGLLFLRRAGAEGRKEFGEGVCNEGKTMREVDRSFITYPRGIISYES
jgi:hypothetical protein